MASTASCPGTRRPRSANPPSQVGIWITDLMLRQAIGRFQRRCLVTSRSIGTHKVSPHSGRRPVGKRQLTDAMSSSHHQPLWWFELMGDKKAWKWEPPTTIQERRRNEKQLTWRGFIDKIVAWLEASDLDKPFLDPPTDAIDQEAIDTTTATEALAEDVLPGTLASHIQDLERAVSKFSALDQKTLSAAAADCCQALEYRLLSAQFTTTELQAALTALTTSSLESAVPRDMLDSLNQRLMGTIIKAVCALCPQQDASHNDALKGLGELYAHSMGMVLQTTYAVPKGLHEFMLTQLMENLQEHDTLVCPIIANIMEDIVADYTQKYVGVDTHERIDPHWVSQLGHLSDMLLQLPERIRQGIAEHMEGVTWDADTPRCNIFVWLFIATRSELYSEAAIDRTIRELKSHSGGYLTTTETVLLVMERLAKRQVLDMERWRAILSRLEGIEYPPFFWVALIDSLKDQGPEYHDMLGNINLWLRRWNYSHRLSQAIATAQMNFQHPELTEPARNIMLAYLGMDSRLPFQFAIHQSSERLFSYAHLRRQLADPEQDLSPHVDWRRAPEIVEAMATFYLEHEPLTDRQAQRGIGWCLAQTELFSEDGTGSEMALQAFVKVIARRMQAGQHIPQARQNYLVTKIRQYHGDEQADKVKEQLSQWSRSMMAHNRLKEFGEAAVGSHNQK